MTDAPSRLDRRLGVGDAVVIGLGSMIGAGVFATIGPAAEAAGAGLLIGLVIAAAVANCNATVMGNPMGMMGETRISGPKRVAELERTTGFEPATLTLAR